MCAKTQGRIANHICRPRQDLQGSPLTCCLWNASDIIFKGDKKVNPQISFSPKKFPQTQEKGPRKKPRLCTVAALRFQAPLGPSIAPQAALRRFPPVDLPKANQEIQIIFAAACTWRKYPDPRARGARTPVTAPGSPQKHRFCGERKNKRSGIRFRPRRNRMERSLF